MLTVQVRGVSLYVSIWCLTDDMLHGWDVHLHVSQSLLSNTFTLYLSEVDVLVQQWYTWRLFSSVVKYHHCFASSGCAVALIVSYWHRQASFGASLKSSLSHYTEELHPSVWMRCKLDTQNLPKEDCTIRNEHKRAESLWCSDETSVLFSERTVPLSFFKLCVFNWNLTHTHRLVFITLKEMEKSCASIELQLMNHIIIRQHCLWQCVHWNSQFSRLAGILTYHTEKKKTLIMTLQLTKLSR